MTSVAKVPDGESGGGRIPGLDGLRGVAILSVLVWHYVAKQVQVPEGSIEEWLLRGLNLSWGGVDLFFVLSGFFITKILIENRGSRRLFRVFYLRRACRILPLYYLLFALFLLAPAASPDVEAADYWLFEPGPSAWTFSLLLQNYPMGTANDFGGNWLSPTWSLAVEEQFYLFLPLLVRFVPGRFLPAVLLTGIFIAPLARHYFDGSLAAYTFTPCRLDSLLVGGLIAVVQGSPAAWAFLGRNVQPVRAIGLLGLCGVAFLSFRYRGFGDVVTHLWLALFFGSLVVLVLLRGTGPLGPLFGSRFLRWFGLRSYAIYLFHMPVSGLVHGVAHGGRPVIASPQTAGLTAASLGAVLLLAEVSFRYIERPFLRLGRRVGY